MLKPLGKSFSEKVTYFGPGPKTLLYGSQRAGYFGTLTESQLFLYSNLKSLVKSSTITLNTVSQSYRLWYKFIINKKIIYVPKKYIAKNVTWQELYYSGLVYGTDDYGTRPLSTPTKQNKILKCTDEDGDHYLKVRLPMRFGQDITSANAGLLGTKDKSEIHLSLMKLVTSAYSGYTAQEVLGPGVAFTEFTNSPETESVICMERSDIANTTYNISAGDCICAYSCKSPLTYTSGASILSTSSRISTTLVWRPYLELCPVDFLFSPVEERATSDDTTIEYSVTVT